MNRCGSKSSFISLCQRQVLGYLLSTFGVEFLCWFSMFVALPFNSQAATTIYSGIYAGEFSGPTDDGTFAALVHTNQSAVFLAFDRYDQVADCATNVWVSDLGEASFVTDIWQEQVSGTVNPAAGSYTGPWGSGIGTASRKSYTGALSNSAGFFYGSFSGSFSGFARAVVAPDGYLLFKFNRAAPYTHSGGGGTGQVNVTTGAFSVTGVPTGVTAKGTLNKTSKVITGTASAPGMGSVIFTLNRTIPNPPHKDPATVILGNLNQTYNGTARSATATTLPSGLTVNLTYNGLSTPPTNAGNYIVIGTINDARYEGRTTNTLVINKATASVILSNLWHTYNGSAKAAAVTTSPTGLVVIVTYNGSTSGPTNAGSYTVVATVDNVNYQDSATNTLVIGMPPQRLVIGLTNGQNVQLQLTGTPNFPYVLQSATNLLNPIKWQSVLTNAASAGGVWNYTVTNSPGVLRRYYRATTP
jgi:hypothetical protein